MIYAGGGNPEALVKDYLKTTKEAVSVLGTIKNQKSAEAAKAKLDKLGAHLEEIAQKLAAFGKKDAKAMQTLQKKYEKQMQAQGEVVKKEYARLEKMPAAWPILEKTVFGPAILNRIEEAREMVVQITAAVETYKAANDEFPATLDALAKKRGKDDALVDAKVLIDPWGRAYQYDLKGPRNQGKLPDIWSQGPAPGESTGIIGNWNAPAKKDATKSK
jgi:hypothetical protein